MHLFIRPEVFTLIVGDDVEALLECLLNTVFVVFDAGQFLPLSFSKSRFTKHELVTVTF